MPEHKSVGELMELLDGAPVAGTRWRHVKTGVIYVVVGDAIHESTLTALVVYQRADVHLLAWARPLTEWREKFAPAEGT